MMNLNEFYCPKCFCHKDLKFKSERKVSTSYFCISCEEKAKKNTSKKIQNQKHNAAALRTKNLKFIDSTIAYLKAKDI